MKDGLMDEGWEGAGTVTGLDCHNKRTSILQSTPLTTHTLSANNAVRHPHASVKYRARLGDAGTQGSGGGALT